MDRTCGNVWREQRFQEPIANNQKRATGISGMYKEERQIGEFNTYKAYLRQEE